MSLSPPAERASRIRYLVLATLFIVTTINYADRASLSIAGPSMQKQFGISTTEMGYLFSAFSWAYVIGQIPGGWLLDRLGSRRVYAASLLLWSVFTFLQGAVGYISVIPLVVELFILRFLMGLAEAPAFPGNSRISAAWFPTAERGTAAAIFSSAQYFSIVIFAPLMAYVTHAWGWQAVFFVNGLIGVMLFALLLRIVHTPLKHPRVNAAELSHLKRGGALIDLDSGDSGASDSSVQTPQRKPSEQIAALLSNRMMLGIYIAQYCVNGLTYFFLTWFPVYLVQDRGMSILNAGIVASLPALCGFAGGLLGGISSDWLLRRGWSQSTARKIPIITGMLVSMSLMACNYVNIEWLIVLFMSLSFFGKGLGAMGWAVIADTAPKESSGLCGGLFNTFGGVAGIITPIVIGYLVSSSGSFESALVFVSLHAAVAVFCYLVVVGEIRRIEFAPDGRCRPAENAEVAGLVQTR